LDLLNNLFKCTGSIIKVLLIKILIEQVQEQMNFIWSLEASGRMRLKKCVWRSASEETGLKKSSWRHVIRSNVIRSNGHQKQLHQSWQRTMYEVYDHELCNHHLYNFVSTSRQDNSNIAADVVPFVMEWIWN